MITDIIQRRPDAFDRDIFSGQNVLLLGAPCVGKSHLLRELGFAKSTHKDINSALDSPSSEFVVLDEFYTAYQAAAKTHRQEFQSWLSRSGDTCVVARPREVDWLVENDDTPLSSNFFGAFDKIYHLRYDPNKKTDRQQAIDCCLSIFKDIDEVIPDRDVIGEEIDRLCKTVPYEYDADPIRTQTESYGETLVPALVVHISDQLTEEDSGYFSAAVSATSDIVENASFSEFYEQTRGACSDLFSRETLATLHAIAEDAASDPQDAAEGAFTAASTVGVGTLGTVAGPAGLIAGGSLGVYLYLRNDDDKEPISRDAVFGVLLSDELMPTAQAELEAELDLPPRTIENFRRLIDSGTIDALLQHRERLDEELGHVQDGLTDVENAIEEYEEDLQRMSAFFTEFEEHAVGSTDIAAYVATSLDQATADIDEFKKTVRAEEVDNVLQVRSVDGEIPHFDDGGDNYNITGNKNNAYESIEQVAAEEGGLILLSGSHGVGKTTAGYRACQQLVSEGYDVRLPNFDEPRSAIEYGLTSTANKTVVFSSFKRGTTDKNAVETPAQFRQLLAWLNEGYCSAVILECRDELYRTLDSLQGDIEEPNLKRHWYEKTEIKFDRLSDKNIEAVIEWVLNLFDVKKDRETITQEAARIAEGNPEIAKIATRFALREDQPLKDFDSYDELIWSDIDRFSKKDTIVVDGRPIGGEIFTYVAIFRQITTDELLALLGGTVDKNHLEMCAKYLSGYLGGDVRSKVTGKYKSDKKTELLLPDRSDSISLDGEDVWSLSPNIYAEVVFRRGCLREGILDRSVEDYLEDVAKINKKRRYAGVSENLTLSYRHAVEIEDEKLQRVAIQESHRLLEHLDNSKVDSVLYADCLSNFVRSKLPILPRYIEADIQRFVSGLEVLAKIRNNELEGETLAMNRLAELHHNHFEYDRNTNMRKVYQVTTLAAQEYHNHDIDPAKFLINVYSMAAGTPDLGHNSNPITGWIDTVDELARSAASSKHHSMPPHEFLENIYSTAIKNLAERHDAASASVWLDAIDGRAHDAASDDLHNEQPAKFLTNVYSMAITNLAERHDPTADAEWLDNIEKRAYLAASSDTHDLLSSDFLKNFHSMSISSLADKHELNDVEEWLNSISENAYATADDENINLASGRFLESVYSLAIVRLAERFDPETVIEWLDVIDELAHAAAISEIHNKQPSGFLESVYSMTFYGLTERHDPETAKKWLDAIDERARSAATSSIHDESPGEFLENVHSMTLYRLADKHNPADVASWLDAIDERARSAATSSIHDESPGEFLIKFYIGAVYRLAARNDPETVKEWLNVIDERAHTTATSSIHDELPSRFIRVYVDNKKDIL